MAVEARPGAAGGTAVTAGAAAAGRVGGGASLEGNPLAPQAEPTSPAASRRQGSTGCQLMAGLVEGTGRGSPPWPGWSWQPVLESNELQPELASREP